MNTAATYRSKMPLGKLNNKKSPVSNGIVAEMSKVGGESMEEEIKRVIRDRWEEEAVPEEWSKSTIVTIAKKIDQKERCNYRNSDGKKLTNVVFNSLQASIEP